MRIKFISGQSLAFSSQLEEVDAVREAYCQFLLESGLSTKDIQSWKLVISEALVNAIVHGNQQNPAKEVFVEWYWRDSEVILEVTDCGVGMSVDDEGSHDLPEDPLSSHGRGMYLISQYCDRVEHWRSKNAYRQLMACKYPHAMGPPLNQSVMEQALRELSSCYESLAAFYRLGEGIVNAEDVSRFIVHALKDLTQVVECDIIHLSLSDGLQDSLREDLSGLSQVSTAVVEVGLESAVFQKREDFIWESFAEVEGESVWSEYACGFCCPVHAAGKVQGVLTIARRKPLPYFNSAELDTSRTFADLMGIAVANTNNSLARLREHRALRELEIASEMQQNLLPVPQSRTSEKWSVFAKRTSAREVAGDYLEVFEHDNGDLLLVAVDVMGKGVSASFLAAMFRTAFNLSVNFEQTLVGLVDTLNRVLHQQIGDLTMFATCGIVKVFSESDRIEIVNAGHCPVLLLGSDGDLTQVEPSGPPLGILKDAVYAPSELPLRGGEKIYMVTDGLYEWELGDQIWGWSAFLDFVLENKADAPDAFWDKLHDKIQKEGNGAAEAEDDQAFLYWENRR